MIVETASSRASLVIESTRLWQIIESDTTMEKLSDMGSILMAVNFCPIRKEYATFLRTESKW
jgi:hypothetical protein